MSFQCISETCDQPMDPSWSFCPACGVDNRAPLARKRVLGHTHTFLPGFNYCIQCGEPADEPYSFGYRWRVRLMGLSWLAGLVCIAGVALTQLGHARPETPLGKWVGSWYSIQVSHRRGRGYGRHYYTNDLGWDITTYLSIGAVVLVVIGFMLLIKAPFTRRSDDGLLGPWRSRGWF